MDIQIYVGTMTGTAELVAEDVADSLFEDGVAGMQQQIEDTLNLEDRARLRNDLAL